MSLDQLIETAAHEHGNILVTCREAENMLVQDPSYTHFPPLCCHVCAPGFVQHLS